MSFEAAVHAQAIELDKLALEMTAAAGSGHPSSAASLGHIVTVLMFHSMRWSPDYPDYPTSDRLVLASADQFMLLLDPATGREIARFPALVPPSRRLEMGECTPVVAAPGWIATLDHLTNTLIVYDDGGRARGTIDLARLLPVTTQGMAAVAAHGEYVGFGSGFDQRIFTVRVRVAPECPS